MMDKALSLTEANGFTYLGKYFVKPRTLTSIRRQQGGNEHEFLDPRAFRRAKEIGFDLQGWRDNKSIWTRDAWLEKAARWGGRTAPHPFEGSREDAQARSSGEQETGSNGSGGDGSRSRHLRAVPQTRTAGNGPSGSLESEGADSARTGEEGSSDSRGARLAWRVSEHPGNAAGPSDAPRFTGEAPRIHESDSRRIRRARQGHGRIGRARAWQDSYAIALRTFGSKRAGAIPVTLHEALTHGVDGSRYSGLPHCRTTRDVADLELQRAVSIVEGRSVPPPVLVGHRVQHGPTGPKVRVVGMYPRSVNLVEESFAGPISKQLKRKFPAMMGFNSSETGVLIADIQARKRFITSIDWSGFDANVPGWLISAAFSILRTHIELNDDEDAVWQRMVTYFIHTPLYFHGDDFSIPEGCIVQKHKGIPSGSRFTSLIGTIVNYMVINYAMIRMAGRGVHERECLILGDDGVIGTDFKVDLRDFASYAEEIGFTLSEEQRKSAPSGEPVPFLGHSWNGGLKYRDPQELVIRMVFPERYAKYLTDPEQRDLRDLRLLSYCADGVGALEISMRMLGLDASRNVLGTLSALGLGETGANEAVDLPGFLEFRARMEREEFRRQLTPIRLVISGPSL